MPSARVANAAANRVTVACLRAAGEVLAIDASQVREVVRFRPPTPLPGAPQLIDGVLDLRGALVPVVDLGRALGRAPAEPPLRRIAVVDVDGLLLGLAAEDVLSVASVDAAALEDPPPLAAGGGDPLVCSVIRRQAAAPIPVLCLEALLARIHGAGGKQEERA